MKAYVVEPDGTAKDLDGRTIFFSFERFKNEVCQRGHCFVCGATLSNRFNSEHVFPNWLLRHCGIHDETLNLPNGAEARYSTYKISCCQECNGLLAYIYETPISKVVMGGYDSLLEYLRSGGHEKVCGWLSLIFLKVHLKDFRNRISPDHRKDNGMIGDQYELSELHHIHAVARAATAGVQIDRDVYGTLVILQLDASKKETPFDYADNLAGRTLLIQIKDIALIYVLDDCGATGGMLSEKLKKLPHPISAIQLREVYARHLTANIHIKKSPKFRTEFFGPDKKPRITVDLPVLEIYDYEPSIFGRMFAGALGNLAEGIIVDGRSGKEALEIIATGRVSFLFDEEGEVRNANMEEGD
ncbi:hypothetical protein [Oricola nitratireducens]|uniref:hypothetical protein n=1 Tax=Oricola nitratireducens TaxID=2775868 RepID=UPI001866CE91|nr:hypothetical protein [Oricola nitratireducens]